MKQLVLAIMTMTAGALYAQTPALYDCIYEYQMQGEGKKGHFSKIYNCILQIGEENSKFFDYSAFRLDSVKQIKNVKDDVIKEYEKKMFKTDNLFDETIFNSVPGESFTVYADMIPDRYRYQEKAPAMTWTLIEGRDTVCGYECRKAETEYGGRKWKVWYAEEIPVPFGPWKLAGLPGLVLKAEDGDGNHRFEAVAFRNATTEITPDKAPNVIKMSHDKFIERKNAYNQNPMSMFETSQITGITVMDKKIIVNGIRLQENKEGFIPLEIIEPKK